MSVEEVPKRPPPPIPFQPNTEREQLLFNHLEKQVEEAKSFKEIINQLRAELNDLKNNLNLKQTHQSTSYETDEEQVEKDTDWITVKNKKKQATPVTEHRRESKKRKASGSPEAANTASTYLNLTNKNLTNKVPTQKKPPPMFVQQVVHINKLVEPLKAMGFEGKISTLNTNTSFKINCANGEEYRKVSDWLNNEQISWHTFSDAATRPLRVMARGLHPQTDQATIIAELKNKGFKILEATNILNKEKNPLRLHMLTFENSEDVKKVFEINSIFYQAVKIEEVKKKSPRIVQCVNCQGYNHTRSFCHQPPRCVKCAGQHLSENCKNQVNDPPTCVNCREQHTANYRGCIVAKELQKLRNQGAGKNKPPATRPKNSQQSKTPKFTKNEEPQKKVVKVDPKVSFAQAAGSSKQKPYTPAPDNFTIVAILERLERKVNQQEQFNKMVLSRLSVIEKSVLESNC